MQQVIAHHFPGWSPIQNALLAFPLALGFAVISWSLVEKPVLRLKDVPSRLYAKSVRVFRSSGKSRIEEVG